MVHWKLAARRPKLLIAALYVIATIAMTWPLAPNAGSKIQDPGDPLFQIWVMRAVQHQLVTDPLNLYHANAFYPFKYSLAYSEEAISTALLAWPVYLVSGNDVLAYNAMFLFSFWLLAFALYLLARELGAVQGAAFIAGLLATFAPARFGHLSHLHMLVIGWLPLALWTLTVFVRGGQYRYLALASGSLLILLLGSLHLAVFGTLALGLYLLFLLVCERRRRTWSRLDLGLLAGALLIPYLVFAPTLYPHMAAGDEYGFERTRAEIERLSANPRSYLAVSPGNHLWAGTLPVRQEPLFPGLVTLLGATLSLFCLRRGARWPAAFAMTLTGIAGLLSLGFDTQLAGRTIRMPYALLYEIAPPIRNIRGVGRFGLLTAVGFPLLAALGFTAAWNMVRERAGRHVFVAGACCTALLSVVVCLELRTAVGTWDAPDDTSLTIYEWLADQPPGPVAEFPIDGVLLPTTRPPDGLFQAIQYMYGSTRHWNPIVSGYSGYVPHAHLQLLSQFHDTTAGQQSSAVTAMNVGVLQDLGIRWIIIHRFDGYDWQSAVENAHALPQLRHVADVGDSSVFELSTAGHTPLPPVLGMLDVDSVAYSDVPVDVIVRLTNPRETLAVGVLGRAPVLTVSWQDAAGTEVLREETTLDFLTVIRPGETDVRVATAVPDVAGVYTVDVRVTGGRLLPVTREVTIIEGQRWSAPPLELVSVVWSGGAQHRPGETLYVDVTWRALVPLETDLAATVQLLDASRSRRAHHDLLPAQIVPPTVDWQPGQVVTLQFAIWIDPALEPGEYELLTAMYFYRGGYPRVPIVLPDGRRATEQVLGGLSIGP